MQATRRAHVGDEIVVTGHAVGQQPRVGEVLEVLEGEREHYRVRWEDGHESTLTPSSDATIRARPRKKR